MSGMTKGCQEGLEHHEGDLSRGWVEITPSSFSGLARNSVCGPSLWV